MARKKDAGIEALKPSDPISIQEITMLDWYAMAATIALVYTDEDASSAAAKVFDLADALMKERSVRV